MEKSTTAHCDRNPCTEDNNTSWVGPIRGSEKKKILSINGFDELRQDTLHQATMIQHQRAIWHDKFINKKSSKLETGHYYLVPGSRTSKENFTLDGSIHTRLIQYMTAGPSNYTP
jgi:hypothetical protein